MVMRFGLDEVMEWGVLGGIRARVRVLMRLWGVPLGEGDGSEGWQWWVWVCEVLLSVGWKREEGDLRCNCGGGDGGCSKLVC